MAKNKKRGGKARQQRPQFAGKRRPASPTRSAPSHTFSLQDEARNTERHASFWNSDLKLRHRGIQFVSAGRLHGDNFFEKLKEKDSAEASAPEARDQSDTAVPNVQMSSLSIGPEEPIAEAPRPTGPEHGPFEEERGPALETSVDLLFVVDTAGAATADTGLPPPTIRNRSRASSTSSEEVVLFQGRSNLRRGPLKSLSAARQPKSPAIPAVPLRVREEHTVTQDIARPHSQAELLGADSSSTYGSRYRNQGPVRVVDESFYGHVESETPSQAKTKQSQPTRSNKRSKAAENRRARAERDAEAIADYIENIKQQAAEEDDEPNDSNLIPQLFGQRPLAFDDGNDVVVPEEVNTASEAVAAPEASGSSDEDGWDSSMLDDFGDISTSSEVDALVQRILSKRTRPNGLQFLVVYDGNVVDDARWVPATTLTTAKDQELINQFEERLASKAAMESFESDASEEESETEFHIKWEDDSDESDDDDDDDEAFEDEKDLIERKIARLTDEEIAARLAKQEELGFASNEVFLFDGNERWDGTDDAEDSPAEWHGSARSARKKTHKSGFPSASLMADVLEQDPYGGFDVMDFDRPSLRKKNKGRRGVFDLELSDKELEQELRSTWEADRSKKSQKKKEREELRAQGLLGKKNKFKADLGMKYQDGVTPDDLKDIIRDFLDSDHQSWALPPMEKKDRAVMHKLAGALNLKSKSVGSGKNRFTTLIKTSMTMKYDERLFMGVTSQRRFGGAFRSATKTRQHTQVGYKDGDVVGASAPAIGSDNRGRAMLEKMGWSSGTALGRSRQGILEPISHTVKTSKLGLR